MMSRNGKPSQGESVELVCVYLKALISITCFAGIWAGMRTVRYFDGKTYKWVGLSRQPNIIGKVSLSLIFYQETKLIEYSVP